MVFFQEAIRVTGFELCVVCSERGYIKGMKRKKRREEKKEKLGRKRER